MSRTIATLLLILGVLDALAGAFCLLFGVPVGVFSVYMGEQEDALQMLVFYAIYGVVLSGLGGLKITAATRLFRGRGWKLAVAAAIACFVNTLICCNVVSLALGLVCLVLLLNPQTRAELGEPAPPV